MLSYALDKQRQACLNHTASPVIADGVGVMLTTCVPSGSMNVSKTNIKSIHRRVMDTGGTPRRPAAAAAWVRQACQ